MQGLSEDYYIEVKCQSKKENIALIYKKNNSLTFKYQAQIKIQMYLSKWNKMKVFSKCLIILENMFSTYFTYNIKHYNFINKYIYTNFSYILPVYNYELFIYTNF